MFFIFMLLDDKFLQHEALADPVFATGFFQ